MPSPAIPNTSLKGREHLYSLYTSIPRPPPAFNSLPAVRSDHLLYSTQRKQVTAFDQLVEEGGAVHALKDVLTKEIKRVGKSRSTRVVDAQCRQRKGRARARGTGKQEAEGEQGESEDAGDEFTETPRRGGPKKGGGRSLTYLERMAMPEVSRPQVEIPDSE